MAEHDRRGQFGGDGPQSSQQIWLCGHLGWVRAVGRPAKPAEQLANGSNARPPAIGDSQVDGDAMNPGFGRSVRTPPRPGSEGVHESVLSAVLGLSGIGQDGDEGPEYAGIRHSIEAVEVVP